MIPDNTSVFAHELSLETPVAAAFSSQEDTQLLIGDGPFCTRRVGHDLSDLSNHLE